MRPIIKLGEKPMKFLNTCATKIAGPENRLILGVSALASQPFIDYYNKNVDEKTRKYSVCKTISKIIIGTTVGVIVRSLAIKYAGNLLKSADVSKIIPDALKNPESRKTIESWIYDDNKLIANLGYAIRLKATNPDVSFTEQYDYDSFKSVSGELIMLGISPWNDFHLFRTINASGIERCTYYYWDEEDCTTVKSLLCSLCEAGKLVFESAKEFWRGMEN